MIDSNSISFVAQIAARKSFSELKDMVDQWESGTIPTTSIIDALELSIKNLYIANKLINDLKDNDIKDIIIKSNKYNKINLIKKLRDMLGDRGYKNSDSTYPIALKDCKDIIEALVPMIEYYQ